MKVNKDKKGGGDKASVAELRPWPSYIEVCVLDYCDLLTYCTYSRCNCKLQIVLRVIVAIISGPLVQLSGYHS